MTCKAPDFHDHPVICVVGPTASGKSHLSQLICEALDGEVVSADSMQVYRGMDIGTGKVPTGQRTVAHHGLDLVDPGQPFSAALFQSYARTCFEDIRMRRKRAVLCGGTGFYVRAAIDAYEFPEGGQIGNAVRDRYSAIFKEAGAHELWLMLEAMDSKSAHIIPENDVKRVIRAFELLESGTSYAAQKEKLAHIPQLYPAVFLGLGVKPDILRNRIDERVDMMVEEGLVNEVENLLKAGFRDGITAPQAIGYKEIVSYLDGDISLAEAVRLIKASTHRYAKRQRTWFRKDGRVHWLDANEGNFEALLSSSIAHIENPENLTGK